MFMESPDKSKNHALSGAATKEINYFSTGCFGVNVAELSLTPPDLHPREGCRIMLVRVVPMLDEIHLQRILVITDRTLNIQIPDTGIRP